MPTKSSKRSTKSKKRAKKIVPFELQNIKPVEFQELLNKFGACEAARTWATGKSLKRAFNSCPDFQWLAWLLNRVTGRYPSFSDPRNTPNTLTRKESRAWGGKRLARKAETAGYKELYGPKGTYSSRADVFRKYYTVV